MPASRAPGVSSVGMMRAVSASISIACSRREEFEFRRHARFYRIPRVLRSCQGGGPVGGDTCCRKTAGAAYEKSLSRKEHPACESQRVREWGGGYPPALSVGPCIPGTRPDALGNRGWLRFRGILESVKCNTTVVSEELAGRAKSLQ